MIVEFLEQAYSEYKEAIEFYNLLSNRLGEKFKSEVDRTLSIIKKYPDAFPIFSKNTRKALVNNFPYNIIYAIENDTIIVIAIAHQHRRPDYWNKR